LANELKSLLESLREISVKRLQKLKEAKKKGFTLKFDDGRDLDALITDEKRAIGNLDRNIERLTQIA
jgi:hypothetical protein